MLKTVSQNFWLKISDSDVWRNFRHVIWVLSWDFERVDWSHFEHLSSFDYSVMLLDTRWFLFLTTVLIGWISSGNLSRTWQFAFLSFLSCSICKNISISQGSVGTADVINSNAIFTRPGRKQAIRDQNRRLQDQNQDLEARRDLSHNLWV